jgi:KaiC/GvpD/RAD55 family RecA-like ATPase
MSYLSDAIRDAANAPDPVVPVIQEEPATVPVRRVGYTSAQVARAAKRHASNPTPRIPTGIATIDKMTGGGLGMGEVGLVVGKSGSGKSIVGQNIVENNLDRPGVFFSMEMPGMMCFSRSLAMATGRDYFEVFDALNSGTGVPEGMAPMVEDWANTHKNMYLVTRGMLTLDEMASVLREAEEALGEKPQYVVIDYLELVSAGDGSDAVEAVTKVAQRLKSWAKEHGVAVWVLHQVNKTLRHGFAPDEDSARYGGFTESDIVIGVWRPHRWEPQVKTETAMPDIVRDQLRKFFGINLLKNRPRIELEERGWLLEIKPSGKIVGNVPNPPICVPGSGVHF